MGEYYHLLLLTKLNILLYFLMNHLVVDNFENEDGETKYNSKANNDEQEYSALNIIIKDILVNKLMPFRKISVHFYFCIFQSHKMIGYELINIRSLL